MITMNLAETLEMVRMDLIDEPPKPLREKITEEGLEELKKSMVKRGLINPITLRRKGERYEIEAGHRRFLGAKDLGWLEIKAIVKEATDDEARLDGIHENLHREDMSPVEEAKAISELLASGEYSKRDVARMCAKSESWVDSRRSLLDMPVEIIEAVDVGAISVGAARELAGIVDDQARSYYLDYAIKQGATAALCAFWRGRWEVERLTNDPSAAGAGAFAAGPPPVEVSLECFWCEKPYPIRILNHLRFCPKCSEAALRARAIYQQELIDAAGNVVNDV